MAQRLISVMVPEEVYKDVQEFCFDNDMTIKLFVSRALIGLTEEMKRKYAKKSTKRN